MYLVEEISGRRPDDQTGLDQLDQTCGGSLELGVPFRENPSITPTHGPFQDVTRGTPSHTQGKRPTGSMAEGRWLPWKEQKVDIRPTPGKDALWASMLLERHKTTYSARINPRASAL